MQPTEEDLLAARLAERDPEAWEDFLLRYGGIIEGACRRALSDVGVRDAGAVADASAEVVRALLSEDARLLRRFRPGGRLGAYLNVIARSQALAMARKRFPKVAAWLESAGPDEASALVEREDLARRVRELLSGLPARDAQALRLFHLEGLRYTEISDRLGIPAGQVGMVLARARERLRELGGKELEDWK